MDCQGVSGEVMCGLVRYFDGPPKRRYSYVSRQGAHTPPESHYNKHFRFSFQERTHRILQFGAVTDGRSPVSAGKQDTARVTIIVFQLIGICQSEAVVVSHT